MLGIYSLLHVYLEVMLVIDVECNCCLSVSVLRIAGAAYNTPEHSCEKKGGSRR